MEDLLEHLEEGVEVSGSFGPPDFGHDEAERLGVPVDDGLERVDKVGLCRDRGGGARALEFQGRAVEGAVEECGAGERLARGWDGDFACGQPRAVGGEGWVVESREVHGGRVVPV